mgnify:CR=1 FL=1
MKKRFIALLLVLVMSVSLIGCSKNDNNENDNDVNVDDNSEIDNNEADKDNMDDNKDPIIDDNDNNNEIEDDDKLDHDDKDDLDDNDDKDMDDDKLSDDMKTTMKSEMFEPITNLQVGTPGSSLEALAVSAEWLNVLGDYDIDDDAFVGELKNYYEGLSAEDQEIFKENYSFLSETMLMLAQRDEGMIESLSSAGVSLSDEALDVDDFMEVDNDVKTTLGL